MVRHYNNLYDTSPPNYMDTNLKNQIWQKLDDELQLSSRYFNFLFIYLFSYSFHMGHTESCNASISDWPGRLTPNLKWIIM